ncbi:uncharacterized protein BN678_00071 [Dialister sp. CAG:486]|nr:uncharacterized protein BN678_00071 [Dialister sp. CAG:486]
MIQMSHCLRSLGDIENCIRLFAASYVPGKQSILISIYTHWNKPETIREMIRLFCVAFPEAEIAGMTTAGGIDNGCMRLRQTVVTIQFFEKSDVHTAIYDFSQEPMEDLGEKARSFCQRQKDLSALLLLMTQRYYDFEPFLTALDQLGKDIPICGGYAHTYRNEDGIYVFTKDAILSRGILLVTFSGDVKVMTTSVMGWQPLGRTMTITAIDGPLVIRSLDHKPAAYFYQKYLHSTDFGKSELLFPLVRSRHQVQLSILPLESRSDGALQTNVFSHVGDQVQMAYGDPDQVILSSREALGHIERFAPEGMLLISCFTRRYYLKEDVNQILSAYNDFCVAPGGYVNGELIRIDGKTQATNMTLISVCFREGEAPLVAATRKPHAPVVLGEALSTIQRLATFVTETTKELAETQKQLSFAASHDSFTGLLNRGSIEEMLCRCHKDTRARRLNFSALMIDLDTFKHINDTFGHTKGDEVIREVASILKRMIRPTDFAGRWGGDEFVILLPGITPPAHSS